MWPFAKSLTRRQAERLAEVEERCSALESKVRALDLEWSDVHDSLQRMLGKISKRAKAADRDRPAEGNGADQPIEGAMGTPVASGLTVNQQAAMREIMRRRGMG
jgi:hypothetical protein